MTLLLRSFVRSADADHVATLGLLAVRANEIAALASETPGIPSPNEAALREHQAITGRVHDGVPSLPARFGVTFADRGELAQALAAREDELLRALDRVGARVEMALTLSWRGDRERLDAAAPVSGRAYLEALAARERERDEAALLTARFIADLGYERVFARESICPRRGVAATVALLIPRDEVMRVRRHVASLREQTSEVTVVAYGPLAPYSFAS